MTPFARAVAVDLIGMGRSDKPTDIHTHTIYAHAGWWKAMIDALKLRDVTLFGQDWGGFTSLLVVAHHPDLSGYEVYMSGPPPMIDAVIMAYGPETEYLLRLAQKNQADGGVEQQKEVVLNEAEHGHLGHVLGEQRRPQGNRHGAKGGGAVLQHDALGCRLQ